MQVEELHKEEGARSFLMLAILLFLAIGLFIGYLYYPEYFIDDERSFEYNKFVPWDTVFNAPYLINGELLSLNDSLRLSNVIGSSFPGTVIKKVSLSIKECN